MNKKNQRSPVIWAEKWVEQQLNIRGWQTHRIKMPIHQGDLLAVKNRRTAKIGVQCRMLKTQKSEEMQVYIGFHFHKNGSSDFLILHFNEPNWMLTTKVIKQLNQKFGKPII